MLSPSDEDRLCEARWLIGGALAAERSALDESESKLLARIYGIPVPLGSVVEDEDDAQDTAQMVGFPVAMKAVGPQFQHKTDAGLVVLNVRDDESVRMTYRRLKEKAGTGFQGVLVEKMVAAERELMVGMKRDSAFGPAVAFGVGGVMAEALADVAVAIAPLDDRDVVELMSLIRARKMLGPYRGYPPVDEHQLASVLKAVGQMALDNPEIAEIDINPLLIEKGKPVAADALVILRTPRNNDGAPPRRTVKPAAEALRPVFSPGSVAVVGASADPAKWGGSLLRNIVGGGFSGGVYPINPRGGVLLGREVYPSLRALPLVPDLAFVAVGASQVEDVIKECGACGVPAAVVIAAGFSEAGTDGATLEGTVAQVADDARVTLVGPNTMGLISNECSLHGTGFVAAHPRGGGLSVISQSGNVGFKILRLAEARGAGIAKFIGVGNEARVSSVDVLEYLEADPHTDVVLMYLEGVEDGRRLMDIARRTTRTKPIVVVRGGLTEFGSHAAASHTGAMAGTAAVREASARQTGAMGTTSPEEGVELAIALENLPLPGGPRVAVVTLGGGWGVLAADEIARNGLALAEPPRELLEELNQILPPFWSHGNPFDLVTAGDEGSIKQVLERVTGCAAVDAVLVLGVIGSPAASRDPGEKDVSPSDEGLYPWDEAFLEWVGALMTTWNKPIVNVPLEPLQRAIFPREGPYCPVALPTARAGAQVLGQMAWYSDYLQARAQA
jgi:acyl-CoA synthetase (NDP forming)